MTTEKALIVCRSVHHQNTAAVARVMADVLHADVVTPEDCPADRLGGYGLVGFGSGIYYGRFHPELREWVRGLPEHLCRGRRAFLFSTEGLPFLWRNWHAGLKADLVRKGFTIVGEFHCRGFDTFGPLWLTGGINRHHPDDRDLARATEFARHLMEPRAVATPATPLHGGGLADAR